MMTRKRVLVVGGLAVALVVPVGAAVAAGVAVAASPSQGATGTGPGTGPMPGGRGPQDCPYHDSAQMQVWRAQWAERQNLPLAERQQLTQQYHQRMWAQMTGTTPPS
jgi:hypothetical protein